jgi:ADP-ribose pyrophosphatase YjhB (NUDIX family)
VFQYDYARPALAADICVIHRYDVLLIERKDTGKLALPGGFLEEGETLLGCAFRELKEETSLHLYDYMCSERLNFVKLFDKPNRDPRGWIISGLHYAELKSSQKKPVVQAADDAKSVLWVGLPELVDDYFKMRKEKEYDLAFDHSEMLSVIFNTKFTNR